MAVLPRLVRPMLATLRRRLPADQDRYGREFKWDGVRRGPTTPSLISPASGSSASPSSAASLTSTSGPHRSPGQDRWPSSGTQHGCRNITTPLTRSLSGGAGLPRLDASRLRATWLADIADLPGLATFMHAAGITRRRSASCAGSMPRCWPPSNSSRSPSRPCSPDPTWRLASRPGSVAAPERA